MKNQDIPIRTFQLNFCKNVHQTFIIDCIFSIIIEYQEESVPIVLIKNHLIVCGIDVCIKYQFIHNTSIFLYIISKLDVIIEIKSIDCFIKKGKVISINEIINKKKITYENVIDKPLLNFFWNNKINGSNIIDNIQEKSII